MLFMMCSTSSFAVTGGMCFATFVAIALLTWASWSRYRPGQPIVNLEVQYGTLDHSIVFVIRFVMVFWIFATVMQWAGKYGIRITYRAAWFLYFVVAFMSHLTTWDERLYGPNTWKDMCFIVNMTLHVALENIQCILTFVPRSQSEWYLTRAFVFVFTAGVLTSFVQQKTLITLAGAGGLLAIPADSFTIVAGYGIVRRATDAKALYMGIAWMINGFVVFALACFFGWFGGTSENYTGFVLLTLLTDYVLLCYAVHINVMTSDLADDALEFELRKRGIMAPDPAADEAFMKGIAVETVLENGQAGGIVLAKPLRRVDTSPRTAFLVTAAIVMFTFFVGILVPVLIGRLPIQMLIE